MTVLYFDQDSVGAPALSRTKGAMAEIMKWALPQMGWVLAEDDIAATNRVALTSADGVTYVFYDDNALSENNSFDDCACAVRFFHGFTSLAAPGISAPFNAVLESRFIYKHPSETDHVAETYGYRIWGDSKTFIIITWTVDAADQPLHAGLARPKYFLAYGGRVNGLTAGDYAYIFMGASYQGTPGTSSLALITPGGRTDSVTSQFYGNPAGPYPALYDEAGDPNPIDLTMWEGMTRGMGNYTHNLTAFTSDFPFLSTMGDQVNMNGERHISRVFLGSTHDAYPRLFCRGLYCGVGDWSSFIDSNDNNLLPAVTVDTGQRQLLPLAIAYGFSSTTEYIGHRVFIDALGPWA